MNILISAYACEPNKGSEPGVGWNWAIELSKHHNVWVITRDNNKSTIESYIKENPSYNCKNLKFIYVGLSKKLTFWKKGRRGMRLFVMLWQRKAAKVAVKLSQDIKFDLVQHVTFVSYTQPTYMYKLGIPMIWGPISGGENIPNSVNIKMSNKEKVIELIRKASQYIALMTPSIYKTMKDSKYILVATEETRDRIPCKYREKTIIVPAIGIEKKQVIKKYKKNNEKKIRIIMSGRLIYWKAFDIGIKSFKYIADKYPYVELYILGEGNKKQYLKSICGEYLNKQIFFEDPIPHDEIYNYYKKFDIFLNTTLRDSGCMSMMEAMAVGLPCIAISTGGPKILMDNIGGIQIKPDSYNKMVMEISNQLSILIDKILKDDLNTECNIDNLLYSTKLENIKNIYEDIYKSEV